MKEKSFLRELVESICVFLSVIIFAGSVVTVCVTNTGGNVSKYFDYSSKVVLAEEANGRLNANDLIITKEQDTYVEKDYIWYFTAEDKTSLGEVEATCLEKDGIEYDIKNNDKNVSDVNVIGRVEYRIPTIGKAIVFLKEIPLLVYAGAVAVIATVGFAFNRLIKKPREE